MHFILSGVHWLPHLLGVGNVLLGISNSVLANLLFSLVMFHLIRQQTSSYSYLNFNDLGCLKFVAVVTRAFDLFCVCNINILALLYLSSFKCLSFALWVNGKANKKGKYHGCS